MDTPTALDQLNAIEEWLNDVAHQLDIEAISYGELAEIDLIYENIKAFKGE